MRITQNSMNRTQLAGLNAGLARLQRTQEELTTGKRLVRPSDSPVDTVSAMRLRDQQRSLSALGENIKDGQARLQTADDALTRSYTMLNKIRQLTVAGATGTAGPEERGAYANEIEQIKKGLIQLANTQYAGQPVFGGTTSGDNSFDPDTGAFIGNNQAVLRKVTEADGPAGEINIAVSGEKAFGDQDGKYGKGLFQDGGLLDSVAAGLRADPPDPGLNSKLADLDVALKNLSNASSVVGARSNRLSGLDDQNGRLGDDATVALSKVEDTDFMKAAMDLNIQSNAYNAALQASAKIIQPSLMEFLR